MGAFDFIENMLLHSEFTKMSEDTQWPSTNIKPSIKSIDVNCTQGKFLTLNWFSNKYGWSSLSWSLHNQGGWKTQDSAHWSQKYIYILHPRMAKDRWLQITVPSQRFWTNPGSWGLYYWITTKKICLYQANPVHVCVL